MLDDAVKRLWLLLPLDQAKFTLGLIFVLFLLLAFSSLSPDIILLLGVVVLLVLGMITPADALAGLPNEGMVTVGVLFVVGAGVRETGGVDWIATAPVRPAQNDIWRRSRGWSLRRWPSAPS